MCVLSTFVHFTRSLCAQKIFLYQKKGGKLARTQLLLCERTSPYHVFLKSVNYAFMLLVISADILLIYLGEVCPIVLWM